MSRCNYCRPVNGSKCAATIRTTRPSLPIACTREPGHGGPHVWCDGDHALARWQDAPVGAEVTASVAGMLRAAVVEG